MALFIQIASLPLASAASPDRASSLDEGQFNFKPGRPLSSLSPEERRTLMESLSENSPGIESADAPLVP
jgi:hypothetical protein